MKYKVKRAFVERNGKHYKTGEEVDMVEIAADFYLKNGFLQSIEQNINKKIIDTNNVDIKPKRKKK